MIEKYSHVSPPDPLAGPTRDPHLYLKTQCGNKTCQMLELSDQSRLALLSLAEDQLVAEHRYRTLVESVPDVIMRFDPQVVSTGQPIRFDQFSKVLGKHFEVVAFRTESGQFACIFVDITSHSGQGTRVVLSIPTGPKVSTISD